MSRGTGAAQTVRASARVSANADASPRAVDPRPGFVDEWRVLHALAEGLATGARDEALLDAVVPAYEIAAIAEGLKIPADHAAVDEIRRAAAPCLASLPEAGDLADTLRRGRGAGRLAAADALAARAAADGVDRALALCPSLDVGRKRGAALARPELWSALIAENWTALLIRGTAHQTASRFFKQNLPARKAPLWLRALDGIAAVEPGGGAGGADALDVLNTTTASNGS
jgi:hypothetical protein